MHFDLTSKFTVGFKTLMAQGLSGAEIYGDLVNKFKKIVDRHYYMATITNDNNFISIG